MILNSPYISGSLTVTGNIIAQGGIVISGSIASSSFATTASNALALQGLGSASFAPAGTFNTVSQSYASASGSLSTRVTNLEATSSTVSSSFATTSGSIAGRVTLIEGQYATTGSNNFTKPQQISDVSNAISFTSTASLYTDGGLRVKGSSFISGTAYFNDVVVYGTSSIEYITSSQLAIGTNIITLNTDTPSIRFGGISVFDSGSNNLSTGSLFWDSEKDKWIYSNPSASTYDGGMLISGPRNSSGLGNEVGTTSCALMMGQGGDHITSSAIFSYGNATCFYGQSFISSSGAACFAGTLTGTNAVFTGSMNVSGSFIVTTTAPELQVGATGVTLGNALTDTHNVTGSLRITGSLNTIGNTCFTSVCSPTIIGGTVNGTTGTFVCGVISGTPANSTSLLLENFNGDQTATTLRLKSGRSDVFHHMQAFSGNTSEVFRIEASGRVVSAAGACFAGNVCIPSTALSGNVVFNRANTSAGNNIEWRTASTLNWYIGTRGLVNNNFYFVNEGLGANNLILDATTGVATFACQVCLPTSNTSLVAGTYGTISNVGGIDTNIGNNAYYDGTNWRRFAAQEAARIYINRDSFSFLRKASDGAGSCISWDNTLFLSSTGIACFACQVCSPRFQADNYGIFRASAFRGGLFTYDGVSGAGTDYSPTIFAEGGAGGGNFYIATGGSATVNMAMFCSGITCFRCQVCAPSGVKFGNGSGTLNYYEEGTFSPRFCSAGLSNITYGSGQIGYYTRIGRLVFISVNLMTESLTSSGTNQAVTIRCLPFTSANLNESTVGLTITDNSRYDNTPPVNATITPNTNTISLFVNLGNTGAGTDPTPLYNQSFSPGAGNRNITRLSGVYITS